MEELETVKLEQKKVDILSTAVSNFVKRVSSVEGLEGMFLLPCINFERFHVIHLEIITSDYRTRKKVYGELGVDFQNAYLETGIEIKPITISYYDYLKKVEEEDSHYPIRGMLCSGQIIYDPNGKLEELQKKFQGDKKFDNLNQRGIVKLDPPIQYTKK